MTQFNTKFEGFSQIDINTIKAQAEWLFIIESRLHIAECRKDRRHVQKRIREQTSILKAAIRKAQENKENRIKRDALRAKKAAKKALINSKGEQQ